MQLCASCHRHVKTSPCPFCGSAEQHATRGLPERSEALSRGQLVAASAALVAAACGGTHESAVAIYGAPAVLVDADAGAPAPDAPQAPDAPATPDAGLGGPPAPPPTMHTLYGSPPY